MNAKDFAHALYHQLRSTINEKDLKEVFQERVALLDRSNNPLVMRRALINMVFSVSPTEDELVVFLSGSLHSGVSEIKQILLRAAWIKGGRDRSPDGTCRFSTQDLLDVFAEFLDGMCAEPPETVQSPFDDPDVAIMTSWGRHMLVAENVVCVQKILHGLDASERQRRIEAIAGVMLGHEINSSVEFAAVVDEYVEGPKVLN